ncbi:hypothetical protein [Bifidobacterium scaligerum]|uniref:Uncharacterized protein n=1 Tax=Bifidobacterium scaligerum TaxID=2052656 RepID=A0A2M9HT54_9BIFI|nr:hypothetical protein [Bifidobacterium scaligerum]PJM79992.1 hypothetical protein CUU80_02330 [Bifidobacterium scaligerum]
MTSERRKEMARHWHERGTDNATISRLLGLSEAEVKAIIDNPPQPKPASHKQYGPEFIEPPLFN